MTQDEIRGKLTGLQKARENPEVKFWLDEIKALAETLTVQSYNLSGEEAVRAWGVQKGLNMAIMLDKIFAASLTSQIEIPGKKIHTV
jgi:hypothetical protein